MDTDDDDFISAHNQWNVGEAQNTDNVQTSTELRRYPARQHRPPASSKAMSGHNDEDIFLVEGAV